MGMEHENWKRGDDENRCKIENNVYFQMKKLEEKENEELKN
jgi:hypothetical protein